MKVYAVNGFPLWDAENGVYITETPVEVNPSEWLEAQIAGGIIAEVPSETETTANKQRTKKAEQAG